MELFRKNWRQYSGQRQSKSFCKTRLVALPADDAGPEDRQRFKANELHVSLDLALGLRIEECGIGVGTNRRDKGERFCSLLMSELRKRQRQDMVHLTEC